MISSSTHQDSVMMNSPSTPIHCTMARILTTERSESTAEELASEYRKVGVLVELAKVKETIRQESTTARNKQSKIS